MFDELWADVSKHMMACNVADHLLPFEVFLLAMLMEERNRLIRLEERMDKLERDGNPEAVLDGLPMGYQSVGQNHQQG